MAITAPPSARQSITRPGAQKAPSIEQQTAALAPVMRFAIDEDPAFARRFRHQQSEVVAQRPGKGIAVLHQLAAGGRLANIAPLTFGIEFRSSTVFGQLASADGSAAPYHFR